MKTILDIYDLFYPLKKNLFIHLTNRFPVKYMRLVINYTILLYMKYRINTQ